MKFILEIDMDTPEFRLDPLLEVSARLEAVAEKLVDCHHEYETRGLLLSDMGEWDGKLLDDDNKVAAFARIEGLEDGP